MACSSPVAVDGVAGLVGNWRAVGWTVHNTENPSETIDGLRFFEDWELNLNTDSAFDVSYRVVNQPGIVMEFGTFSHNGARIEFQTSEVGGQLSIAGRTFDFTVLGGVLTLEGPSTISAGLGQAFGFTPRSSQFLNYTTQNTIRLELR